MFLPQMLFCRKEYSYFQSKSFPIVSSQTLSKLTPNPTSKVETCRIVVLFLFCNSFAGGFAHGKSLAWGKNSTFGQQGHCFFIEISDHVFWLKLSSWLACMLWSLGTQNLDSRCFSSPCCPIPYWPTHVLLNLHIKYILLSPNSICRMVSSLCKNFDLAL